MSRPRLFRGSGLSDDYRALEADRRASTVGWVGLFAGAYSQRILGLWSALWIGAAIESVALCLITTDRRFPQHLSLNRVGSCRFVAATLSMGAAIAISGGPHSPCIPLLVLPSGTIAARFNLRDVVAALSLTMVVAVVVTTSVYSHVGVAQPPSLGLKLALIVVVTIVIWGLKAGKILHNDERILDPVTSWLDSSRLPMGFIVVSQDARVMGEPVSMIVCDIRHFKTSKRKHGHCPSDALFRDVAHAIRSVMHPFENVYRLWGGMIAIVLPRTGIHSAISLSHHLRDVVEGVRPEEGSLVISFGISASHGELIDFKEMLDTAGTVLEAQRCTPPPSRAQQNHSAEPSLVASRA